MRVIGHLLLFLVRAHRCGSLFELLAHLTLSTQWLTQEAAQEDHDCLQGSWRPITRLSVPTFCPKVAACGTALRRHRSTDTFRLSPARPHSRHLSCHDLSLSVGCHWNTRCLLGHFSDILLVLRSQLAVRILCHREHCGSIAPSSQDSIGHDHAERVQRH